MKVYQTWFGHTGCPKKIFPVSTVPEKRPLSRFERCKRNHLLIGQLVLTYFLPIFGSLNNLQSPKYEFFKDLMLEKPLKRWKVCRWRDASFFPSFTSQILKHTTACHFQKLVFELRIMLKCRSQDLVFYPILFLRTSNKIVLFTDQADKYDFLGPFMEFELHAVGIQLKSRSSMNFEVHVQRFY